MTDEVSSSARGEAPRKKSHNYGPSRRDSKSTARLVGGWDPHPNLKADLAYLGLNIR